MIRLKCDYLGLAYAFLNPPLKKFVGGGLISGVALAAKSINPAIRVFAAEPKGANDAAQSKNADRIITLPETNTIADGLRASLGDLTWYRGSYITCVLFAN